MSVFDGPVFVKKWVDRNTGDLVFEIELRSQARVSRLAYVNNPDAEELMVRQMLRAVEHGTRDLGRRKFMVYEEETLFAGPGGGEA